MVNSSTQAPAARDYDRRAYLMAHMPKEAAEAFNPQHFGKDDYGDGWEFASARQRENPHLWAWDGVRWIPPTKPGSTWYALACAR